MKTRIRTILTFALLIGLNVGGAPTFAQTENRTHKLSSMKVNEIYPLITTDKIKECKEFYLRHFGFTVLFEKTIFLQLSAPLAKKGSISIAFMPPNHPFGNTIPGPLVSDGKGLIITLEVDDSEAFAKRLKSEGVKLAYEFKKEKWGQKHFMVRDPAGTLVDVVQGIDPEPGYYDRYEVK